VSDTFGLKPLRRAQWWLGLWGLAIVSVVVASLVSASLLPQVPAGGDKFEHFLAYFLLAAAAVQLFASRAMLIGSAVGLVLLGIALEIAQGLLTSTRQMDPHDALANTVGVIAGMATALTPMRDWLLWMQRRRSG
jgi:VanZ family protein